VNLFFFHFFCTGNFFEGNSVEKKNVRAIDGAKLSRGFWRVLPMRSGVLARSLVLGLIVCIGFGGLTVLVFYAACQSSGSLCSLSTQAYIIFKASWAMLVAGVVYALVFVAETARIRIRQGQHHVLGLESPASTVYSPAPTSQATSYLDHDQKEYDEARMPLYQERQLKPAVGAPKRAGYSSM
jgi:hypothetical protein